jgi:hypothetical protein
MMTKGKGYEHLAVGRAVGESILLEPRGEAVNCSSAWSMPTMVSAVHVAGTMVEAPLATPQGRNSSQSGPLIAIQWARLHC